MVGILSLLSSLPLSLSPSLITPYEESEKPVVCKSERGPSLENQISCHLNLGLPSLQNCQKEKKFLLFKLPNPFYYGSLG